MPIKLFERSEETSPGNLSDRLAYGRNGVATKNITWTNFITWLNGALSFLKPSNNLSDVGDVATARTNLDVLDSTTINNAIDLKADKTNVLEKDNTTSYTPTQDFHPGTKIYIDEGGAKLTWQSISNIDTDLAPAAALKACKVGPIIYITGLHEYDAGPPPENDVLYTLPVSFPLFTETFYFSAVDAGIGRADESSELKALAGTRNIVAGGGASTGTVQYVGVAIPVI